MLRALFRRPRPNPWDIDEFERSMAPRTRSPVLEGFIIGMPLESKAQMRTHRLPRQSDHVERRRAFLLIDRMVRSWLPHIFREMADTWESLSSQMRFPSDDLQQSLRDAANALAALPMIDNAEADKSIESMIASLDYEGGRNILLDVRRAILMVPGRGCGEILGRLVTNSLADEAVQFLEEAASITD